MKLIKIEAGHYQSAGGRVVIKQFKARPYFKEGPSYWQVTIDGVPDEHHFISLKIAKSNAPRLLELRGRKP